MLWRKGLITEPKDPSDVLDYKFDFAGLANAATDAYDNWLQTGETISTATLTVATGLTKDSDSITDTNTSVTVWLSGGTDGTDYTVACKVVTSAPRTLERSIIVRVENL